MSKYGVIDVSAPVKMLTVFPGTPDGLNEAIIAAERPDAMLVRLAQDYAQATPLIKYVEAKIKANKAVRLFRPTNRIPRS